MVHQCAFLQYTADEIIKIKKYKVYLSLLWRRWFKTYTAGNLYWTPYNSGKAEMTALEKEYQEDTETKRSKIGLKLKNSYSKWQLLLRQK